MISVVNYVKYRVIEPSYLIDMISNTLKDEWIDGRKIFDIIPKINPLRIENYKDLQKYLNKDGKSYDFILYNNHELMISNPNKIYNDLEEYICYVMSILFLRPYLYKTFLPPTGYLMYLVEPSKGIHMTFKSTEIIYGNTKYEILCKLLEKRNYHRRILTLESTIELYDYKNYVKKLFKTPNERVVMSAPSTKYEIHVNYDKFFTDDEMLLKFLQRGDYILDDDKSDDILLELKKHLKLHTISNEPIWDFENKDKYDPNYNQDFINIRINMLALELSIKLIIIFNEPNQDKNTKITQFIIPIHSYYNLIHKLKPSMSNIYEKVEITYKKDLSEITNKYNDSINKLFKLIEVSENLNIMQNL
jgi:hypothetical protein